jgi:hypothetical protein
MSACNKTTPDISSNFVRTVRRVPGKEVFDKSPILSDGTRGGTQFSVTNEGGMQKGLICSGVMVLYQFAIEHVVLPVGAPGRSPERSQAVPSVAEEISQEKPLVDSSNITC